MAITGIFTKQRPNIGGFVFDAVLEESDELQSEATRYSVEDGSTGNDHVNVRNMRISMTVAISDNYFKALAAQASAQNVLTNLSDSVLSSAISIGASAASGVIAGALGGAGSAIAGLGASIANASYAAGQAQTRSGTALDNIRALQRSRQYFTLITSKASYKNCVILRTARTTDPSNEGGLILLVEMEAMRIMDSTITQTAIGVLPSREDDPAGSQAYPYIDTGRVVAQPLS